MVHKEFLNGIVAALLLAACFVAQPAQAKGSANKSNNKQKIYKVLTNDLYAPMDINDVMNYYSNDGDGSFNPNKTDNEGFEFPIGSTVGTCIFEDGLVWTAFKDSVLYCGGSTYNHGLQAGGIAQAGTATTPPITFAATDSAGNPVYKIYRVRPDIKPATDAAAITAETNLLNKSEMPYFNRTGVTSSATVSVLLNNYWYDWTNWPAAQGAPFTDANGVGHPNGGSGYNPATCIPGFPGADQTMWMIMNDMDTSRTQALYGSNPIGIEVQRTIWAYNRTGSLSSTIFVSYKFINKSGFPLDNMYVSQWCDPDLGFAGDDATGCDTTRSLGFVYNGEANDANFASLGLPPPSAGFDFFQGPIVPGAATDTAIFDMQKVGGHKNLKMTGFTFFINGNTTFGDPNLTSNGPDGTQQWYNLMRGLVSTTGQPFPAAVTGGTNFCYWGDPVTGVGPTFIGAARVSAPADVRMCLISGPFSMAAGDTQQVVVAELGAEGSDYLSSVSYLKYYADINRTDYDYLFNLPSAPPAPKVNVAQLNGEIILSWGDSASNAVEEHFSDKGYAFQGYNVWQLSTNSPNGARRLATYDLNTSQGIIQDLAFDAATGYVIEKPVEFGTHSGLEHSITITQDAFTNTPIVNDRDYYFAVTAYSYNGAGGVEPNYLESPISGYIQDARAQTLSPGVTAPSEGAFSNVAHSAGNSEAVVNVNVVAPDSLTGHQYQMSFHDETYSLGADQIWTDVTAAAASRRAANKKAKFGQIQDLTGSSVSSTVSWSEKKGSIDVHFLPDVEGDALCDGIALQLPAGVVLDTTYDPISNNTGNPIPWYFNKTTNTIFYGDSSVYNNPTDTSKRSLNGTFAGGEDILITLHPALVPIMVNYTMYDDNEGATLVDVSGIDTVAGPIALKTVTQHQWNLMDLTSKSTVLSNQTIISGADLYDQAAFFKANGFDGPGGSSGTLAYNVGVAPVVVNGFTVSLAGSYFAPTGISEDTTNGKNVSASNGGVEFVYISGGDTMDVTDYRDFGVSPATALNSLGAGTTDLKTLEENYELKWTGVLGDTTINGLTVVITKSGGSMASLYKVTNYTLGHHPLNPNPGSNTPFLIRIPFEVWNTTKHEQINLLVRDRNVSGLNDPTQNGFQVWNTRDRMYVWPVDTKYDPTTVLTASSPAAADSATWNWVFMKSQFHTGDDIIFHYNRNIVIGSDTYTFTLPKPAYSSTLAKQGIGQINVFPNPYFGFNKLESDKYDRWVRFTHLPQQATVRIFSLAGILVRTLTKNDNTQFLDWNLLNESKLPVASGMYVAYVDCPGLGTKTLKLALILEQQFLDHY